MLPNTYNLKYTAVTLTHGSKNKTHNYFMSLEDQTPHAGFISRSITDFARFILTCSRNLTDSSSNSSAYGKTWLVNISFCGLNPRVRNRSGVVIKSSNSSSWIIIVNALRCLLLEKIQSHYGMSFISGGHMRTVVIIHDARPRNTTIALSLTNQINIEFTQVIEITLKENRNIRQVSRELRSFSQKFDMRHFATSLFKGCPILRKIFSKYSLICVSIAKSLKIMRK